MAPTDRLRQRAVSKAADAALQHQKSTMNALTTQLVLEDLLADLRHARRLGDLGRLAFVIYCEVRRWAREAGQPALAELASDMVIASPHTTRARFLEHVDALICALENLSPSSPGNTAVPNLGAMINPTRQGASRV